MSKKKEISKRDIKLLWGPSGNKCAICKTVITEKGETGNPYPIGENAHIEGEKPKAVHYNPNMTDKQRNVMQIQYWSSWF